jgi:hypothetical protein
MARMLPLQNTAGPLLLSLKEERDNCLKRKMLFYLMGRAWPEVGTIHEANESVIGPCPEVCRRVA